MAAPAPPVAADAARTADASAYSGESTQEKKLLYTFETLAQHNTREELWMLLHDKVYDVTAFMDEVRCSFLFFGAAWIWGGAAARYWTKACGRGSLMDGWTLTNAVGSIPVVMKFCLKKLVCPFRRPRSHQRVIHLVNGND